MYSIRCGQHGRFSSDEINSISSRDFSILAFELTGANVCSHDPFEPGTFAGKRFWSAACGSFDPTCEFSAAAGARFGQAKDTAVLCGE